MNIKTAACIAMIMIAPTVKAENAIRLPYGDRSKPTVKPLSEPIKKEPRKTYPAVAWEAVLPDRIELPKKE